MTDQGKAVMSPKVRERSGGARPNTQEPQPERQQAPPRKVGRYKGDKPTSGVRKEATKKYREHTRRHGEVSGRTRKGVKGQNAGAFCSKEGRVRGPSPLTRPGNAPNGRNTRRQRAAAAPTRNPKPYIPRP